MKHSSAKMIWQILRGEHCHWLQFWFRFRNLREREIAAEENQSRIFIDGGFRAVPIAACPECEVEIHVDEEMDKGDTLTCEECEAILKVVGLDPIELDAVTDEDEEEFYEDDDEDEMYYSHGRRRGRSHGGNSDDDY
jgi:alpha-aminoadipate carrier protein LysW